MEVESSRKFASKVGIVVLWIIALALLLRLFVYAAGFSRDSLQQDFSAFYTAGEALNHGLDPYQNHLNHDPPVWDGMNHFRHSRFLYPPLVATIFQSVALIPYKYAKILWTIASFAFQAGSLFLLMRMTGVRTIRARRWALPVIIIFVSLYYPLLTHLERGQIDTLTLLFFVLAISDLSKSRSVRAGAWFALATLFKLHSIYVLPFLLLRRNWKTLGGYALSGAIIIVLSFFINGTLLPDYLFKELPEISLRGERGTYDDLLPGIAISQKLAMLGKNQTDKDGVIYRAESFPFEQNASLIRIIGPFIPLTMSAVSVIVFACLFLIIAFFIAHAQRDAGKGDNKDGQERDHAALRQREEIIFWQIVMVVILLSGPLTWVMNTVWLLPALFILIRPADNVSAGYIRGGGRLWGILAISALILTALPDLYFFDTLPFEARTTQKYVIAEFILLISLLGMMKLHDLREKNPSDDERPSDEKIH